MGVVCGVISKAPKRKRRCISAAVWREVKAAFFVGGELRALAREAGINENTVLHKAMREGWTEERRDALAKVRQTRGHAIEEAGDGEPIQSVTIARERLLERHVLNMLNVCERVSDHVADLPAPNAFAAIRQIDTADRLTRRQLGLDREEKSSASIMAAFAFSQCQAELVLEANVAIEPYIPCEVEEEPE